jgi:hypothetical protein
VGRRAGHGATHGARWRAGRALFLARSAGAAIDLVQLTPALVVAGTVAPLRRALAWALAATFVTLALSVWVAGLMGVVVAAREPLARGDGPRGGPGRARLRARLGAFRSRRAGSLMGARRGASPFHALHTALLD